MCLALAVRARGTRHLKTARPSRSRASAAASASKRDLPMLASQHERRAAAVNPVEQRRQQLCLGLATEERAMASSSSSPPGRRASSRSRAAARCVQRSHAPARLPAPASPPSRPSIRGLRQATPGASATTSADEPDLLGPLFETGATWWDERRPIDDELSRLEPIFGHCGRSTDHLADAAQCRWGGAAIG